MNTITVKDCLENEVFHGHLSRKWNPKMKKFLHSRRNGVDIIDIEKTISYLDKASIFLQNVASRGGKILFVAPQKSMCGYVKEIAESLSMPYITEKWLGGTLTNFVTIRKTIKKLENIDSMLNSDVSKLLSKKERECKRKNSEKKRKFLDGIFNMYKIPAAIFIVNVKENAIAVQEAINRHIPIVGIVDTNSDPTGIDYIIPANDDSLNSVKLILNKIAEDVKMGSEEFTKKISVQTEIAGAEKK